MTRARASLLFAVLTFAGCGRGFLYQRTSLPEARRAQLGEHEEWDLATLSVGEVDLQGLVRRPHAKNAPWILFFGGNATDLAGSHAILERIRGEEDFGLAVFAYRGYDGSEGRPTQRRLTEDGVHAAKHLEALGGSPSRLVIVGQSLGSAVATQVTAELQREGRAPVGLALVSPFTAVRAVARDHLGCAPIVCFPDPWRTQRRAPEIRVKTLVLHGNRDRVIPFRHGEEVAAAFPDARFVEVDGRDHNDMWTPEVAAEVRAFVRERAR